MKNLLEFVSFVETFPSAVSSAIGNGWTAQDVLVIIDEIRDLAQMPKLVYEKKGTGALKPIDPAEHDAWFDEH